jgi:Uma2 family endonuclease
MTFWTAPEGTFTIEEFKRLPLEGRRWELLDGKVVQMEPLGLETSAVTATLLGLIGYHVHTSDLGVVHNAGCGYRCWPGHETVRVTDGSFTRHETIPADRDRRDFPHWRPDLIIEVFSPFERAATMLGRVAMFPQAGTRLVWIVDPTHQIVTAFSQRAALWTVGAGDTLEGGDILSGFSVPVAEIFE